MKSEDDYVHSWSDNDKGPLDAHGPEVKDIPGFVSWPVVLLACTFIIAIAILGAFV